MKQHRPSRRQRTRVPGATFMLILVGGCQHFGLWCDHCADIPHGAVPAPPGTYNAQWQQAQATRADEDHLVFYQYEWLGHSNRLSPFGERHLERLLDRFPQNPSPIIVETSGDDRRDQQRIAALRAYLAEQAPAWEDYPIEIGRSQAEPLYGVESPRVTNGFIGGRGAGGQVGGFGGGGSGFGGGGVSSGGGGFRTGGGGFF
ncbi:MAG: hypothetical protein KatS3mg111_1880 [Pirellulaceae bacterium]|nr:MAG: hypothetical protein KatS3mg111_1880 [Pirellulaceae bacterium]